MRKIERHSNTISQEEGAANRGNRREYESVLQLQSREVREREERIKLLVDRRIETDKSLKFACLNSNPSLNIKDGDDGQRAIR